MWNNQDSFSFFNKNYIFSFIYLFIIIIIIIIIFCVLKHISIYYNLLHNILPYIIIESKMQYVFLPIIFFFLKDIDFLIEYILYIRMWSHYFEMDLGLSLKVSSTILIFCIYIIWNFAAHCLGLWLVYS